MERVWQLENRVISGGEFLNVITVSHSKIFIEEWNKICKSPI